MDYQIPSASYPAKLARRDSTKHHRALDGEDDRLMGVMPASHMLQPMLGVQRAHSVAKSQDLLSGDLLQKDNNREKIPLRRFYGSNQVTTGRERLRSDTDKQEFGSSGIQNAREGRQFTVGNVGNNGKLYLRCVTILRIGCETRGVSF